MAKTGIFTQILGYDPEERKRKRQEEAARVSASLLSGDPYRAIGFSIGELFGAGANKLFGSEDPEIKFQSTVREAISSASQNYEAGSADYYKALAASLPQTSEYSNSIATARELAQKAGQEEEKQFRDTTKFVADNPEALTGEAQKLNARIAAKLRAAGVDPTQPLSRVNEMGVAEPIDPVYSEKVNQFIQALPETQRLNALTQAATRGSMKLDMDLNKPESMPKIGFAADDGQAVYRQGDQQFKLGVGGQRTPYFGGFRKEGADITINTPKERFAVLGQFREAIRDVSKQIIPLNRALELNSRKESPLSAAALKQELGSAFGDSQKAASEISALGNTGALDTRIAGRISSFLTGTGVAPQKSDIDATLKALRDNVLKPQYESIASTYRAAAGNEKEANLLFPSFEKQFALTRGLEPKAPAAPDTVSLSAAQKKDPRYAEGSIFTKPDGSVYTVQNGVLVKQKKKEQ